MHIYIYIKSIYIYVYIYIYSCYLCLHLFFFKLLSGVTQSFRNLCSRNQSATDPATYMYICIYIYISNGYIHIVVLNVCIVSFLNCFQTLRNHSATFVHATDPQPIPPRCGTKDVSGAKDTCVTKGCEASCGRWCKRSSSCCEA